MKKNQKRNEQNGRRRATQIRAIRAAPQPQQHSEIQKTVAGDPKKGSGPDLTQKGPFCDRFLIGNVRFSEARQEGVQEGVQDETIEHEMTTTMIVPKTKVRVDDDDDEVDHDEDDDDDQSQKRIRVDGGDDDPSRSRRRRPLRRHDPTHNVKNLIGTAAAARTKIPNPTSGHLKVENLIQPLDT